MQKKIYLTSNKNIYNWCLVLKNNNIINSWYNYRIREKNMKNLWCHNNMK